MKGEGLSTEEIYEALLDEEALSELSCKIADFLDARSVMIHWHYPSGGAELFGHSGYFTDEQLALYTTGFAGLDPWARAAAATAGLNGVATDLARLVSPEAYERSAFYNEYIRGIGDDTFRCMGLSSATEWGLGMIAVQRGRTQPAFSERHVAALQGKVRHLRRVLDLRGKLSETARRSRLQEAMLDTMRDAALLVERNGRLVYANQGGMAVLESEKGLRIRAGKVEAAGHGDQANLARRIAMACIDSEPATLRLDREAGLPVIVAITPIHVAFAPTSALLMIHRERRDTGTVVQDALQSLFGLTGAESSIALLVSEGLTVSEMADRRQVSRETIRTQLKIISQKSGCRGQGEIAKLIRQIPAAGHIMKR